MLKSKDVPRITHHASRFTFHVSRFTKNCIKKCQNVGRLNIVLCLVSVLLIISCGKNRQIEAGEEMLRNGQFTEAKGHFENLLRMKLQEETAHYYLGRIAYILEQYQEAIEHYEQSLVYQQNPEVQIALGEALLFNGQRAKALRIFSQTLQLQQKKTGLKKHHIQKIAGLVGDAFHVSRLTRTDADNYSPAFSSDGGHIAFTSYRDENGEIYIMNSDGTEQKRLTHNKDNNDYSASFSADGTHILFASSDERLSQANVTLQADGSARRNELIYLIDTVGNQMVPLTNSPTSMGNPVFSPDGKTIAFEGNIGDNLDIYLMDADGKNRRRITTHPANDGQPAFSPDGQRIAFVSFRDENYELYVMDVDGANQRRVTFTPVSEYEPAFSPDGKQLAFVSARGNDLELGLLHLRTGEIIHLTNTQGANINPTFSPDGKLAFASDRTDYLEIYLMDLHRPVSQREIMAKIKR